MRVTFECIVEQETIDSQPRYDAQGNLVLYKPKLPQGIRYEVLELLPDGKLRVRVHTYPQLTKRRLAIIQETGIQLGDVDERHIREFVPFDDLDFGKAYVRQLNHEAELPFYLVWVDISMDRATMKLPDEFK